ncbi:hypothetical protein PC39_07664 [Salinisphaera sp. PC39]|uniref:parallel beta-helix domain-containing protein n=1 Tax=Salinisphaera sp. PC39 TaxID=1304156 RepID=UPI00333E1EE1
MDKRVWFFALALAGSAALSACGGSSGGGSSSDNAGDDGSSGEVPAGRTFQIEPGPDATEDALTRFIDARPGDTIEFGCGFFQIDSTLLLTNTEAVTIKGCGMDRTVLSFRNNNNPEGLLVDDARGITIEGLTVADTDGNAFELRNVDHGTLRGVRAFWSSGGGRASADPITADNYQDGRLDVACTDPATQDPGALENNLPGADTTSPDYTVSDQAGRYGIYPVKSQNILVEESESIGASDAGIYVGQTSTAIIRDSRAAYNVFGFEIENVRHGEYSNNLAECNTGGFLIYDLDNLTQYGERTLMHDNVSRMNNTYNFTEGGFVSNVPPGSGMITLAYDRIDVYNNVFEDNNTAGIIHVSYELFPEGAGRPSDNKIDFYTEGMRIFDNEFRNNGNSLPVATTNDLLSQDITALLPALVGLKTQAGCVLPQNLGACLAPNTEHPEVNTGFRGAHIVWDGLLDEYDPDCPYPEDSKGEPVPEEENFEGKPRYTNEHPDPGCHYNAYKFHTDRDGDPRKKPLFFASCIDANNSFSDDSIKFANFHGTEGVNAAIALATGNAPTPEQLAEIQNFPADFDMSAHECDEAYGKNLGRIEPVEIPPFEPSVDIEPPPTPEEIAALCNADVAQGEVNFDAGRVDCPNLAQYNLFADPDDPTSEPNGKSFPFVLNTKLFSDYAVKYRVAFLPPGERATYMAPGADSPTGTIVFPTGTIIAKTFSFVEDGEEAHIETRLLIKREGNNGTARWRGLPYLWETDESGEPVANLKLAGATVATSWDFTDSYGKPQSGSTDSYSVPNANQCISCHANRDLEGGSAPIGPKVRNLNRPYQSESTVVTDQGRHPIAGNNQIAYLCDHGFLAGCPDDLGIDPNTQIATNLERLPRFDEPGDSGFQAGSDEDIEARARAYFEVNCHHCHNPDGFASNTGYFLDTFRRIDTSYGICKGPTAAGAEGSGGREVDVHPGDASSSIVEYRIGPEADTPAAKMPPISRSVVHAEGHALIRNWINNVVVADNDRYPGSESCAGN